MAGLVSPPRPLPMEASGAHKEGNEEGRARLEYRCEQNKAEPQLMGVDFFIRLKFENLRNLSSIKILYPI